MAKTADRCAVAIHHVEFAMVPGCERGDIIDQDAGVECWLGFQTAENNQRFFPITGAGDQLLEGVSKARNQLTSSISDHEDDIGPDSFNHVIPADCIIAQHCEIIILNASARVGSHVSESRLDPFSAEFSGIDRWVNADNSDFVTLGIGDLIGSRCLVISR